MLRWAPPELIAAALTGDEAAVERLIAAVWPRAFRLAAAVIGDGALAQDAAQEACVVVHRKVRSVRFADAFDAWLYRVVLREAGRVRRRHAPAPECVPDAAARHEDAPAIDVWRALDALAPELRDVTVLFYFDDLKSHEIAAVLGIRHGTVRTRLARARDRLRGLLDDYRDASAPLSVELRTHVV